MIEKKRKILFVAMSGSVHTARWISQLYDQGMDIHLFPSIDQDFSHPALRNITVHNFFYSRQQNKGTGLICRGIPVVFRIFAIIGRRVMAKFFPNYRSWQLRRLIKRIKPDIVHSLEIQHAGYLTLEAKKGFSGKFPPWIVTNWGSDIYLFGRLAEHELRIRAALASCDFYSCECRRDVCLAKAYGFEGTVLPVFPNTGGFDLEVVERLWQPGPVSARRLIMLKGYQHWAGRALVGLRALERCADVLKGYEIAVYSATPDVVIAAELFALSTGIPISIVPKETPHNEILRLHGRARISIGISISDAVSTSMLEAMVMGAFPIQSWTACADEWITDGMTGLLVPPEDPDVVEKAIRRALADNDMVDRAAVENRHIARERLDHNMLKQKAAELYTAVAGR